MRSVMRRDLVRAEALAEVERPAAKLVHIPVVESMAGEHRFGSYVIHLEQEALDGITSRLSGKR
jgi:hypothetical protein